MSGDISAAEQPLGDRFANMDDTKRIVEGFNEVLEQICTDLQELKEWCNNSITNPVVGENTTVQHELDETDAELAARVQREEEQAHLQQQACLPRAPQDARFLPPGAARGRAAARGGAHGGFLGGGLGLYGTGSDNDDAYFADAFEEDYDANWERIDHSNYHSCAGRVLVPHEDGDPLTKVKITMPKFVGGADSEAYQKWEMSMDKIFRMHDFNEDHKIKLASLEFEDYALMWWEKVQNDHRDNGQPPIIMWS